MKHPIDNILKRRSIRKFSRETIEEDVVQKLIDAADAAPCAKGIRSWQFIIIDDRTILDNVPSFHPYSRMILNAPMAILVCGDTSLEPNAGYWVQNCSAATENMLLAASSMDLGTVWLGIYPRQERISGVKDLIELPDHIIPFSLVVVGRPDEHKQPHGKHDPSRVHRNRW